MFFVHSYTEFASYADDNTPYNCGQNFVEVIRSLCETLIGLFKWYEDNFFKANIDKCHLFVSPYEEITMKLGNFTLKSSDSEELLGITIDSNLSFEKHLTNLCRKSNQKLHALSRIAKYMDLDKRRIIMRAFIISQFNYCPLVWMCHSRRLNNKINHLHE